MLLPAHTSTLATSLIANGVDQELTAPATGYVAALTLVMLAAALNALRPIFETPYKLVTL